MQSQENNKDIILCSNITHTIKEISTPVGGVVRIIKTEQAGKIHIEEVNTNHHQHRTRHADQSWKDNHSNEEIEHIEEQGIT